MNEPEAPQMDEEQLQQMLASYKNDFIFYGPKILKVLAMEGRIVPFVLNGPQRILHRAILSIEQSNRLVRMVLLKARRMGFSTYFSGRYYHKTTWNYNRLASQITHEPEATDTLFKMVKRFYDFSPEWLRPSTKSNNTKLLEFNTKDGKGLGSGFRVATAAKEDFGSGQLIHYFHGSELAKWPQENTESLLTSVLQCVPDEPDTEVAFESTAKGIGGEYYDRFWNSRFRIWIRKMNPPSREHLYGYDAKGKYDAARGAQEVSEAAIIDEAINDSALKNNIYTSIFLPWFCFEKYQTRAPEDFQLESDPRNPENDEAKMMEQYGLTIHQLYWRRQTIANKCNGNVDIFNQEYPDCPEHAFLASGRPVFDNQKLLRMKDALKPPVARYECMTGLGQFIAKEDGRLKVWKEPKTGRSYIVAADVAEGLTKGDFSCADVIDHATGEQVARWHGKTDPDLFAVILKNLGSRYNDALIAPERNNHGLIVVTHLVNDGYPNVYAEMVPDPPGKPRKRFGWVTSNATRPLIIDNLVKEVREGTTGINDTATLEEMMAFKVQENGKMEADSNRHDDSVISLAIGKHVRQCLPVPRISLPSSVKKRLLGGGKGRRSPKGWT